MDKNTAEARSHLWDEILAQYKNLDAYKPSNYEDLHRTGAAIIGSAKDLIDAVTNLMKNSLTEANVSDDRIIEDHLNIILVGFNNNRAIHSKVDTGAEMCSLDANHVNINEASNVVTFSFGDRKVSMPLVQQLAVSSADGGVEQRPVVEFNVLIPNSDPEKPNKTVKNVRFNLNDRTGMPDKILLGQNFIKAGNFVIMNAVPEKNKVVTDESLIPTINEFDLRVQKIIDEYLKTKDI